MPENEFSSQNSGRVEDAAHKLKHPDELAPEELRDRVMDAWDGMDETDYDPARIDAYLAELEKHEPISPVFDAGASLAAFHEKHAQLFEHTQRIETPTVSKSVHRRSWRTLLAAATIVALTLCSMVTAQAFGLDLFGAIARWTEETFHFRISSQPSAHEQNIPAPAADGEFATLQEALDAYGLLEPVAPTWYPAGFKTAEISADPRSTGVTILAYYEAEGKSLSVSVRQYATMEDANINIGSFEKDAGSVTQYECEGITHYLMSNNSHNTATWANDALFCAISGDLSVDDLQRMIDSIYER